MISASRGWALLATLALLGLLLWPFWQLRSHRLPAQAEPLRVVSLARPSAAMPARTTESHQNKATRAPIKRPALTTTVPIAQPDAVDVAATSRDLATVNATLPEPPASTPLQLDERVLRRVMAQSTSPLRQAAQAAGQGLPGDHRPSRAERLASGMAASSKPDCLAPGGSLLSVFSIAYMVATDKCK